jgi:hypothetical protein
MHSRHPHALPTAVRRTRMQRSLHHTLVNPSPYGHPIQGRPSPGTAAGASIRIGRKTWSREFHVTASEDGPAPLTKWPERLLELSEPGDTDATTVRAGVTQRRRWLLALLLSFLATASATAATGVGGQLQVKKAAAGAQTEVVRGRSGTPVVRG